MLATVATPRQNSLRVSEVPSLPETFGVVEIQHRATGATVRYTIPSAAQELLDEWNENLDAQERFEAVMAASASSLFVVERLNLS